ncbi:MAG: 2-dehydropantoate 2-reductase, partial [Pseudomonadota bacterium]
EPIDIIWLTIKCTATAQAVEPLRPFVDKHTVIVCCQNGFGSDQAIHHAFPDNPIHHAIVGFNVAEVTPNHLRRATEGDFVIDADLAARFNFDFGSDLMPLQVSADMLASRWAKLQLNLGNAVNAMANVPVKTMLEDLAYRRVIAAVMAELIAVTKAKELSLPKVTALPAHWIPSLMTLPNWLYLRLAQTMLAIDPTARASMWWDIKNGKQTEVDFLNGAVVAEGQKLGIPTPANQRLIELVKQVESGELNRDWSAVEFAQRLLD